jgi:hypothetical protein
MLRKKQGGNVALFPSGNLSLESRSTEADCAWHRDE